MTISYISFIVPVSSPPRRALVGETGAWLYVYKEDKVIDAVKKMAKANVGESRGNFFFLQRTV